MIAVDLCSQVYKKVGVGILERVRTCERNGGLGRISQDDCCSLVGKSTRKEELTPLETPKNPSQNLVG